MLSLFFLHSKISMAFLVPKERRKKNKLIKAKMIKMHFCCSIWIGIRSDRVTFFVRHRNSCQNMRCFKLLGWKSYIGNAPKRKFQICNHWNNLSVIVVCGTCKSLFLLYSEDYLLNKTTASLNRLLLRFVLLMCVCVFVSFDEKLPFFSSNTFGLPK